MEKRFVNNRNAVTLAFLSFLMLAPGYFLPFMSIIKFGREETYSLVSSIIVLNKEEQYGLAMIVFLFSVLFPLAKLSLIMTATTNFLPLAARTRENLHRAVSQLGKYSMLDVLVVAILVVTIKMGGMTEVRVLSGTACFCVSVLLSILSGQSMNFHHLNDKIESGVKAAGTHETDLEGGSDIPVKKSKKFTYSMIPTFMLAVVGLVLVLYPINRTVNQVELMKHRGFLPPILQWDKPDYFLTIHSRDGKVFKTDGFEDMPIGNGLIFKLPDLSLAAITEVVVWDENVINDEALDRVNVHGIDNEGQHFIIKLKGPYPKARMWGIVFCVGAGMSAVVMFILFIRRHSA